jgi:hypothetical protein
MPKSEDEQLREVLERDFGGLSARDAQIALEAAQRDRVRRERENPEAAERKRVSQMLPNEFEAWKRSVGG